MSFPRFKTPATCIRTLALGLLACLLPGSVTRLSWESVSACATVMRAPEPVIEPAGHGGAECPVVHRVGAAFAQGDDLDDDGLKVLRTELETAIAERPAACVAALGGDLAKRSDCGIVYDAVAIRILTGKRVDPVRAAGELLRPSPCQWKFVAALRELETLTPPVLGAVLRLTASANRDVRGSAWKTLGTVERIAKKAGQADLAACADGTLADALARSRGEDRLLMLSASGNGPCEACRPIIFASLTSEDLDVRRTAATALRFFTDAADVERTCKLLRTDPAARIRGAAAYALRFEKTHFDARIQCLFDAATSDEVTSVAKDAVASIAELSEGSEQATGTLVLIFRSTQNVEVRKAVIEALRPLATDEAIRDALGLEP